MSETTGIEWTDATINFWWGCTKVGPGCDHCYAETWSARFGETVWGAGAPRRKIKSALKALYRMQNAASWWAADYAIGKLHDHPRRRVFLQSMSDLFDAEVPVDWFAEAWGAIEACDSLELQIVTKRLPNVEKRLSEIGADWPAHAGLIASVVSQAEADRDIPRLRAIKASLSIPWVGLSMEPLLGPVVLRPEWLDGLDWIIVGGESGPNARPMHPDWARSLRDQCAETGTPFHFKQWGEYVPCITDDDGVGLACYPDGADSDAFSHWEKHKVVTEHGREFWRVGKKAAGRLLDGVEHNGVPGAVAGLLGGPV